MPPERARRKRWEAAVSPIERTADKTHTFLSLTKTTVFARWLWRQVFVRQGAFVTCAANAEAAPVLAVHRSEANVGPHDQPHLIVATSLC